MSSKALTSESELPENPAAARARKARACSVLRGSEPSLYCFFWCFTVCCFGLHFKLDLFSSCLSKKPQPHTCVWSRRRRRSIRNRREGPPRSLWYPSWTVGAPCPYSLCVIFLSVFTA